MLYLQIPTLDISQLHYQHSHCLTLLNSFGPFRLLITCDPPYLDWIRYCAH